MRWCQAVTASWGLMVAEKLLVETCNFTAGFMLEVQSVSQPGWPAQRNVSHSADVIGQSENWQVGVVCV